MKTAVVFVDNNVVNIVLGKLLKQVKTSELALDHNVEFFEILFSEHQVVIVDQVTPITKEAFFSSFDTGESETERLMAAEASGTQIIERPAPKYVPKHQPQLAQAAPPPPRPAPRPEPMPVPEEKGYGIWLKSNAKAIIIVDDILTDQAMKNVPGAKMSLCIHPDRAVDISTFDKQQIKKSNILRKLLANGTLSECSYREAQQIEDRYWAKEDAKRAIDDKDLDKMILKGGVSAADYASGVRADDEIQTVDFTSEVANGKEAPVETEYDDLLKTMRKNREEPQEEPQSTLAQQIAMAEEDEAAIAAARQRRMATRDREVDPSKPQARGFRRTSGVDE
jgi:hypothetical protein